MGNTAKVETFNFDLNFVRPKVLSRSDTRDATLITHAYK